MAPKKKVAGLIKLRAVMLGASYAKYIDSTAGITESPAPCAKYTGRRSCGKIASGLIARDSSG